MSVRELKRQEVMSRVDREEIGLGDAAALMEVSYRQAKRIWSRYRKEGAQGLVHQSAGRASSRSKPAEFRAQVLAKIQGESGKKPRHASGPMTVCEWENGWIKIYYRDREVRWEQIAQRPPKLTKPRASTPHRPHPEKPQAEHPWRKPFRQMTPRKKMAQKIERRAGQNRPGYLRFITQGLRSRTSPKQCSTSKTKPSERIEGFH